MRQFCDLVVEVISIRPGTGVSKNSKRMDSSCKKPSINLYKQIKTENSNGSQNGGFSKFKFWSHYIMPGIFDSVEWHSKYVLIIIEILKWFLGPLWKNGDNFVLKNTILRALFVLLCWIFFQECRFRRH